MTSKNDFNDDDWKRVASAPIIAAAVISASDDVGEDRDSEDEEIAAFRDAMQKLGKKYAKSDLVTDVIEYIIHEGTREFEELFSALGASASHENPLEDRIRAIADVNLLLDDIEDAKEAKQYKIFVMDAATAVASASKEGFFVFGSKISKKEDFYLRQIQSALDL